MTKHAHVSMLIVAVCLGMFLLSSCKDNPATTPQNQSVTLSGVARDEQGYIVPNARIDVINQASTIVSSDTTDEFGMFELRGLPSDYTLLKLLVHHTDFKTYEAPVQSITSGDVTNGALLSMTHLDSACARLSLTVSSQVNSSPIEGALVRLFRNETLVTSVNTDQQGKVEFNYLMAGTYLIKVTKPGYLLYTRTVTIQYCDTMSLDIRLETGTLGDSCCFGQLRVIPKDSVTNTVMIGATVKLTGPQTQIRTKTAGQDGALFQEMCPGQYAVRISRDGYQVKEFSVTMGCNDIKEVTALMVAEVRDSCCNGQLRIIPQATINNVLQNLIGATVKLTKSGMDPKVYSSGQSGVLFTGLCPGTYGVRISKEGFQVIEFSVTQGCDQTQEITKEMTATPGGDSCCLGSITVLVRDSATTNPLQNVNVKLWRGSTVVGTATTGSNGTATFINKCQGQFQVNLYREGYRSIEYGFSLGCNEQKTVELTLGPPYPCATAILKLRVKDSTIVEGGWLSDATVILRKLVNSQWVDIDTGLTDAEGWYMAGNLTAPATYQVSVSKTGFLTRTYQFYFNECKTISETIRLPK